MSGGVTSLGLKTRVLVLLALAALVVLVLLTGDGSSGASAGPPSKSGQLRVLSGERPTLRGVYAGGRRIRVKGKVARAAALSDPDVLTTGTPAPIGTPLLGYEAPVGVPSPN
jgi:hypothetical protein